MSKQTRRVVASGLLLSPLLACKPVTKRDVTSGPSAFEQASQGDLVELVKIEPSMRLDLRYATTNNFTGRVLYTEARAFLVKVAAEALARAHRSVAAEGLGLTIYDAYRPWRITKALWDATPQSKRDYVANPKKGSRHNRGCAVDLTLHRLADGQQVEMPSAFDDFSERAHRNFMSASRAAIANRLVLERVMGAVGFQPMSNEWWHFDFQGWQDFPVLDRPFDEM